MGTNKRYAEQIDRRMDQRIVERLMADTEPGTLAEEELELDVRPLTRTPRPLAVTAWVHYGTTALKVDALAVAWTAVAVAIKWRTPAGAEHRAWVWSSAVSGRDETPPNASRMEKRPGA